MRAARANPRVLGECFRAFVRPDEFTNPVDGDAFEIWMGETLHMWRQRLTKG